MELETINALAQARGISHENLIRERIVERMDPSMIAQKAGIIVG